MTIYITPDMHISEVQEAFSRFYPHLKLQFFSKPHGENKGSFAKFMIHERNTPLQALNPDLSPGELSVAPDTMTWSLEQALEAQFGLHVQVFRQSGTIWLETSVSDHLSLAEQEAKGKRSQSDPAMPQVEETPDYREQE